MMKTLGAALLLCSVTVTPVLANGSWDGSVYPQQDGTYTAIVTNSAGGKTEVVGVFRTKREARQAARRAKRLKDIQVERVDPPVTQRTVSPGMDIVPPSSSTT